MSKENNTHRVRLIFTALNNDRYECFVDIITRTHTELRDSDVVTYIKENRFLKSTSNDNDFVCTDNIIGFSYFEK